MTTVISCSSASEPSSVFSGVARSLEVSCKSLQQAFPAALAHESLINRLGNRHLKGCVHCGGQESGGMYVHVRTA